MMMRKLALLGAAFLLSMPATAKQESANGAALVGARAAVESAMQQVLSVLENASLSQTERRSKIETIAYANFDFRTMSKLVLRRDWKKFSDSQRVEFVEAFKLHLAESYGSRLERYEQQGIKMVGERPEARGDVTVKTEIEGGQFDGATVDYRMRQRKGNWLAIDVIIEGVSLVSNFHSQFAGIVGREGPEGLLERLREKNSDSDES